MSALRPGDITDEMIRAVETARRQALEARRLSDDQVKWNLT